MKVLSESLLEQVQQGRRRRQHQLRKRDPFTLEAPKSSSSVVEDMERESTLLLLPFPLFSFLKQI